MRNTVIFLHSLICLAILFSCGKFFEKGFPQYSGEITKTGVDADVNIYRDKWGVPHIWAGNEADLYFAQGFVHAQDRLWQMVAVRRLVQGRTAEITGRQLINLDVCAHLLGMKDALPRLAEQASPEAIKIIEAYCKGINHYIETHKDNLPLEFSALDFVPEPFVPQDIFSVMVLTAWFLNQNYFHEILALKLHDRFDVSDFNELLPAYPGAKFPDDSYFDTFQKSKIAPLIPALSVLRGETELSKRSAGSNNWVVSGRKTQSSKPMLANDPHLALTVPSVWYFNHLHSPEIHCTGASMPGAPGIVIGHNEAVAWGFTNVMADYVDLYLLRVDPQNPIYYEVDGQTLKMEKREIKIAVKDEEPVTYTIYCTIHGPVVTSMEPGFEVQVALKWIIETDDQSVDAFLKINRARTVQEVLDAVKSIRHFALNLLAADIAGNIGWQVTGNIPIRHGYSGRFPVDGSRNSVKWSGFIPFEELPRVINPAEGMINTSNNRIVEDGYPYTLSYAWGPPYRSQRIAQLLNEKETLTSDDFQRIHCDVYSLQAKKIISLLNDIQPQNEDARWALEEMRAWDYQVTAESRGALIYEQFLIIFTRVLLADEMQDDLPAYYDCFHMSYLIFDEIFSKPDSRFWDRIDTPQRETREEIIEQALTETVSFLKEKFGNDRNDWRWGRLHKIYYQHPGGQSWFTAMYMNVGPFELGGDNNTVNLASSAIDDDYYKAKIIPSLRMIIDMADINHGLLMGPMGQSGQPQHPHYRDLVDTWRNGDYFPMYFEAKDVLDNKQGHLVLKP